jgi:hypothetical protein
MVRTSVPIRLVAVYSTRNWRMLLLAAARAAQEEPSRVAEASKTWRRENIMWWPFERLVHSTHASPIVVGSVVPVNRQF